MNKLWIVVGTLVIGVIVIAMLIIPSFLSPLGGDVEVTFYDEEDNPVHVPPVYAFIGGEPGGIITYCNVEIQWTVTPDTELGAAITDLYINYDIIVTAYVRTVSGSVAGSLTISGNGITASGSEMTKVILSTLIGVESIGKKNGWLIEFAGSIKASGYIDDVGITEYWSGSASYLVGWAEEGFTLTGEITVV